MGHTNALLDKYVRILSKSEKITKLVLDERWQGAEAVCLSPISPVCISHPLCDRTRNSLTEKKRSVLSVNVVRKKSGNSPNKENESDLNERNGNVRNVQSANG